MAVGDKCKYCGKIITEDDHPILGYCSIACLQKAIAKPLLDQG
jgi:hypothetical protein